MSLRGVTIVNSVRSVSLRLIISLEAVLRRFSDLFNSPLYPYRPPLFAEVYRRSYAF